MNVYFVNERTYYCIDVMENIDGKTEILNLKSQRKDMEVVV